MYKYDKIGVAVFAIVWFGTGVYWLLSQPKQHVIVYDCSRAETAPEFPIDAKEECRKYRSGRI
jgi:hypothetical protein